MRVRFRGVASIGRFFRTAGARKLSTEIRRFGEMVVRDISPASGRIIALRYNLSCSFNTTFVVILGDRIWKVGQSN